MISVQPILNCKTGREGIQRDLTISSPCPILLLHCAAMLNSTRIPMPHGQPKDAWNWNYQVYVVDQQGDILETIALADSFAIADAAFWAGTNVRSWSRIELRNKSRVIKFVQTGAHDRATGTNHIL